MPAILCAGNFRMLPDTAQTSPLFNMPPPQFFLKTEIFIYMITSLGYSGDRQTNKRDTF